MPSMRYRFNPTAALRIASSKAAGDGQSRPAAGATAHPAGLLGSVSGLDRGRKRAVPDSAADEERQRYGRWDGVIAASDSDQLPMLTVRLASSVHPPCDDTCNAYKALHTMRASRRHRLWDPSLLRRSIELRYLSPCHGLSKTCSGRAHRH